MKWETNEKYVHLWLTTLAEYAGGDLALGTQLLYCSADILMGTCDINSAHTAQVGPSRGNDVI